jgi:hypothetical protein
MTTPCLACCSYCPFSVIVITIMISTYAYMSFEPANYKFPTAPIYNKALAIRARYSIFSFRFATRCG